MANFISGLFLLLEKPFKIGDQIKVGNTRGTVHSLGLFSIQLKAPNNTLIRIPNEQMLSSQVENLTALATRRFDLALSVAYDDSLEKAKEVLLNTATAHPLALAQPEPQFMFIGFGDSGVNIQLSVWCQKEHYFELSNTLPLEVKNAFATAGITIPYPHITLENNLPR